MELPSWSLPVSMEDPKHDLFGTGTSTAEGKNPFSPKVGKYAHPIFCVLCTVYIYIYLEPRHDLGFDRTNPYLGGWCKLEATQHIHVYNV